MCYSCCIEDKVYHMTNRLNKIDNYHVRLLFRRLAKENGSVHMSCCSDTIVGLTYDAFTISFQTAGVSGHNPSISIV